MPRTRLVMFALIVCLAAASCSSEPTDNQAGEEQTEDEGYPEAVVTEFLAGCTDGQSRKYCECVIEKMQATVPFSEANEAMASGDQAAIAAFFEEHRSEIVEPCLKFAS